MSRITKSSKKTSLRRYSIPLTDNVRGQVESNAGKQGRKPNDLIQKYINLGLLLNDLLENPQKYELLLRDIENDDSRKIMLI